MITITIKILLLQLAASHETARRHPSSPRRKLIICPTPIVANKLPCDRSWQGATAPAARHKTQETQPLSVPLTNRLDLRTLGTNGPTRTPHSPFLPPGSLPPRRLARRYATFLFRRTHRTRPTLLPSYRILELTPPQPILRPSPPRQVHARGERDGDLQDLPRKLQLQHSRHPARGFACAAWLLAFSHQVDATPPVLHQGGLPRGY